MYLIGFIHRATIFANEKGSQRLTYKGNTYRYKHITKKENGIVWMCTKGTNDRLTGKRLRCPARVITKVIKGFDMLKPTNKRHYH